MSKRYAIWDKVSPVLTPSGEVFTAEEWKARYPAAKLDSITVLCSAGEINGGFYGTLGQLKHLYETQGAQFDEGLNNQQLLDAIEAWEDEQAAKPVETEATAEERIAAALEYQNLLSL